MMGNGQIQIRSRKKLHRDTSQFDKACEAITNTSMLIVDDEDMITETLRDILEELDYTVMTANSGYEAIDRVTATPFDVILMDIRMPGINGVEAYMEIKRIRPDAVVIMMTAYSVKELEAEALKEGAHSVMYKPLNLEKVIKLIKT